MVLNHYDAHLKSSEGSEGDIVTLQKVSFNGVDSVKMDVML